MTIFLSLITSPIALEVARAGRAGFERQRIGVNLVKHLEGRLIALHLLENALL